jgi:hypothetical protein
LGNYGNRKRGSFTGFVQRNSFLDLVGTPGFLVVSTDFSPAY